MLAPTCLLPGSAGGYRGPGHSDQVLATAAHARGAYTVHDPWVEN